MTTRTFLRNDGQFQQVDAGSISISTTTTTGFLTYLTKATTADVLLNNVGTYFDGPSVAQGSSGTWYAFGTVCCVDTVGQAVINIKLWDGVSVFASARSLVAALNDTQAITVAGIIASPAGNIRISANDATSTSGKMIFNGTGLSQDSNITVIRIG